MDVDWFDVNEKFPADGIEDENINATAKQQGKVLCSMGTLTIAVFGVTALPSAPKKPVSLVTTTRSVGTHPSRVPDQGFCNQGDIRKQKQ